MQINSVISQWGNGLAVRLNSTIIEAAHLAKGSKVSITVDKNGVHIQPFEPKKVGLRLPLSEDSLIADITPSLAHADELAQPLASEVGE
ncbi:MAG: MazF family transcriptional regulator [Pseudomonadales bacterium]